MQLIQKLVIDIMIRLYDYNIKIVPHWLPRMDPLIQIADLGSKDKLMGKGSQDYGVSHSDFLFIHVVHQGRLPGSEGRRKSPPEIFPPPGSPLPLGKILSRH